MHEHPTQALLDLMTIREKKGAIHGLQVAIIGDIAHSRVARSNIIGLKTMGARVMVAGPPTMIPPHLDAFGVEVSYQPEEIIPRADVIMMLRVQLERQKQTAVPLLEGILPFLWPASRKHEKSQKGCDHHASRTDQPGGGTPSGFGRRAVFGDTRPGNQRGRCSDGHALPALGG